MVTRQVLICMPPSSLNLAKGPNQKHIEAGTNKQAFRAKKQSTKVTESPYSAAFGTEQKCEWLGALHL